MLEAGLALIACCLPTLNALLIQKSVDSIVRSVRSAISLGSLRPDGTRGSGGSKKSNGSKGSKGGHGFSKTTEDNESHTAIVYDNSHNDLESHAMADASRASREDTESNRGKIWVNHSLQREENRAV